MSKPSTAEEINPAQAGGETEGVKAPASEVAAFDLSHLDRIPKSQLRAIHLVHENFVKNLSSNLSAYLRSAVALNLVSLEQISYSEFLDGFSLPTCIAYISLAPFEGTAVIEMNTTLMFTLMELLMGSKGRASTLVQRKITEIEKSIVQTLMRVILRDLTDAWQNVAAVKFAVQSISSEPNLMHVLSPSEAVIVISVDVHVGTVSGLMNLAIPSIFIKRLRHKFDPVQTVRKPQADTIDPGIVGSIIQDVELEFSAILHGGLISARTLFEMEPGDVIVLDHPLEVPLAGNINGHEKWSGTMASSRDKLVFGVEERDDQPPPSGP